MFDATRTTRVLGALLVSMTLGALLLMLMESDPPRPSQSDRASIAGSVLGQHASVSRKWRRVIIHSAADSNSNLPARCHFVIEPKADSQGLGVRSTELWKRQKPGYHALVAADRDYNADSIGICLVGDFSKNQLSQGQFDALVALVRDLQRSCTIDGDSVYLYSQLDAQSGSPGRNFPVADFDASLLQVN
ncbi:MAG: N-acetylmuramoyl-L-alanine amidase [Phycisphaerae bacterium]|nr:N-acetylmuramoyl-L-alanine amidase [Phycisphaerae bacterium]